MCSASCWWTCGLFLESGSVTGAQSAGGGRQNGGETTFLPHFLAHVCRLPPDLGLWNHAVGGLFSKGSIHGGTTPSLPLLVLANLVAMRYLILTCMFPVTHKVKPYFLCLWAMLSSLGLVTWPVFYCFFFFCLFIIDLLRVLLATMLNWMKWWPLAFWVSTCLNAASARRPCIPHPRPTEPTVSKCYSVSAYVVDTHEPFLVEGGEKWTPG